MLILINGTTNVFIPFEERAIRKVDIKRWQVVYMKCTVDLHVVWTEASKREDVMQRHRGCTKSDEEGITRGGQK